jgi:hypothetical protein
MAHPSSPESSLLQQSCRLFSSSLVQVLTLSLLAPSLGGCPSTQVVAKQIDMADADGQQATCKVAKDPMNPLIVEWPGTEHTNLQTSSRRGLVVVSYAGCTLKVLPACEVPGEYERITVTPSRDKLQIGSESDLYAQLPLGAASLRGELKQGANLELDYISVGQLVAKSAPSSKSGACEGATHYVRTMTVGAFSLDSAAKGSASAGVDVAGIAGGGGQRRENVRNLRSTGSIQACAENPEDPSCSAVLKLGLVPLNTSRSGQVLKSEGFGGVGAIAEVPTVQFFDASGVAGAAGLQAADTQLLDLLQAAKRAERDDDVEPMQKAMAWDALAKYEGASRLRPEAERQRDRWQEAAIKREQRRKELDSLREKYSADKARLAKLLGYDDDVVNKEQKAAYKDEFEKAYASLESELIEAGALPKGMSVASAVSSSSGSDAGSSSSYDDSDGKSILSRDPAVGEEWIVLRGDFGFHSQTFEIGPESSNCNGDFLGEGSADSSCRNYSLSGKYVGGTLTVNFDQEHDAAFGVMAFGRYYLDATFPQTGAGTGVSDGSFDDSYNTNLHTTPTGAFAVGGGIGLAAELSSRMIMRLGANLGYLQFLDGPRQPSVSGTCTADGGEAAPSGVILDTFLGLDLYVLPIWTIGASAAVGWGTVSARGCAASSTNDQPTDLSGDSWSATLGTHTAFHF